MSSGNKSSTIEYTLKRCQSEIASCNIRFRCVNAGRRFGKSWFSGAEVMKRATSKEATERGDYIIWYVAPTNDQARNIMWDGWLKKHIPAQWIAYKNEQRMVMQLTNGTTIYIFSAEAPDHLVGTYIDFLVMDECALIDEAVYEKIRPSLSDHQGDALFISTPRGFNWFYKLWMREKEDPKNWKSFQYTTIDGENVPLEEIEQAKRDMTPRMFKQEYLASFETMANRIYDSYDDEENTWPGEIEESWSMGDLHIGMDFNVNPMTATVSVMLRNKELGDFTVFFDEFYEPNSNTAEMAKLIRKRYPFADIYIYPDPTGRKRQTSAAIGVTDFTILEDAGFTVLLPSRGYYKEKDKFNTANNAFCNAAGERHAYIAKGTCPHYRGSLKGYTRKENGDPDKSSGFDHITDAGSYFICYRLPMKENRGVSRLQTLGI